MVKAGDLVRISYYPGDTLGVVVNIHEADNENKKPYAKILMKNGISYNFLLDDITVVAPSGGKQDE